MNENKKYSGAKILRLSRLSIYVLFFLCSIPLIAQNGSIKGAISDAKTGEPLIGASVMIEGASLGAAADLDGNFEIKNVPAGVYKLTASYVSYESLLKTDIKVETGKETLINFSLNSDDINLEAVEVVARANRESENILLMEQRKTLVATQAVGARELSRKGISNAQAAVAQVSGISKQEGVKNVFVRGLGDRYNATLLNGFPIPSEDPEYKNISLEFFGTDIIQNIGVSKVFSGSDYSDVGGAVIDITSKELMGDFTLGIDLSAGINSAAAKGDFLQQDGADFFGFANTSKPVKNTFSFPSSLDPKTISLPINHGFGISGGKSFKVGESSNPLSFYFVASHSNDYSATEETVRNTNTAGTVWQDQTGNKYSQTVSQLILGNATLILNREHNLQYNMMIVHDNDQYVGDYQGLNSERHQDSPDDIGFLRRQQMNDNLLIVNQLMARWKLSDKTNLDLGASYNMVDGNEPDRRENYFSKKEDGMYVLTGSDRQKRFFSALTNSDFNIKAALTYKFNDKFRSDNSSLKIGYNGRFVDDKFEAVEYNFTALGGRYSIDNVKLDDLYNQATMDAGKYRMRIGEANTYHVTKYVHSAFAEVSYQLLSSLTGNVGLRMDKVDMTIDYYVQTVPPGTSAIDKSYFLPSLNLKYDVNEKNSMRLGISKTYTLPQSKEISPYQYVNISFVSEGNPKLQPSNNYNADLKWDYYMSAGELLSLTGFFKYVENPIGRTNQGNSAGLLTYNNISDHALVSGIELEIRKNIFNQFNTIRERVNRLSIGLNASYIYTNLKLKILDTEPRDSGLEGASPFLANMDISYNCTKKEKIFMASLVFKYFSDRIHTIGTRGYKDIIEKGLPTLDFVTSYKFSKHLSVKAKASNLFNAKYRLERKSSSTNENIELNSFTKGQNFSLGVSYEF